MGSLDPGGTGAVAVFVTVSIPVFNCESEPTKGFNLSIPHIGAMEIDQDKFLRWLEPRDPTQAELEAIDQMDPVDYEVYSEKLNLILEEGMDVFIRTGMGPMLLAGDVAVALYTAEGELVTSNCGTYLHVLSGQVPVKLILEEFADSNVGLNPGDIFYCNDARYGAIHNPDQFALIPIFHDDEIVAWAGAGVHTSETGATEPGGMPITAKSRYDDGMVLSPIKIGENYEIRDDLLEMTINFMGRAPTLQRTDMTARVSACDRVRQRIKDVVEEKGVDFVETLFRQMLVTAETGARKRIAAWPDGEYTAISFSDAVGEERQALQRIKLTLRKEGDSLTFDFTGTSPESDGPFHLFPVGTAAHAAIYIYGFPFHDLPKSIGTYAPLSFEMPEGSVLNPQNDASVANCVFLGVGVISVVNQAFSKLMYSGEQRDLVSANMGNEGGGLGISGRAANGERFSSNLTAVINTVGSGAFYDRDGVDAGVFPFCPFGRGPDVEQTERNYPILHQFQRFWTDSMGAGKYRGGSGLEIPFVPFGVPFVNFMWMSKSTNLTTSQGLFGGYAPSVIPAVQIEDTDLLERLRDGDPELPKSVRELVTERNLNGDYKFAHRTKPTETIEEGDVVLGFSPAGAGYGDPLERDPHAVITDLEDGFITEWTAERVYGVAFEETTDGYRLDVEATEARRMEKREERGSAGQPFDEFEAEWSQRNPPEDMLEYYGSWPDAEKVREIIRA